VIFYTFVVVCLRDSETSEQSSENNNTRLYFVIALVILALCLLLSLAVNVYQRRRFQNNNRKKSHKLVTLRQADQTGRFAIGTYVISFTLGNQIDFIACFYWTFVKVRNCSHIVAQ
jgi:NADH:ubiquinone oxidoreductase subunit 6 (subunit J)